MPFVQANNVIKVGISSDRRYGPVMNYELALKIARRLSQRAFTPAVPLASFLLGTAVVEMGLVRRRFFSSLPRARAVITACGVFSGNGALETIRDVAMVVGSRDPVAALGRIAYPGRLSLLPLN